MVPSQGIKTCRICGKPSSYDEHIDDGRWRYYYGYCSEHLGEQMYLQSDWKTLYNDALSIKADLGVVLPTPDYNGWIEDGKDTLYIDPIPQPDKTIKYLVYCWNDPKAREKIASYLGKPVTRIP